MQTRVPTFVVALCVGLIAVTSALAQPTRTYNVTVTNITPTQIISPPVLVAHSPRTYLFRVGEPASAELAALAEDADGAGLLDALDNNSQVFDYSVGTGPLLPGDSVTLEIDAAPGYLRLSALGMLVTTNDAFFGLDTHSLSSGQRTQRLTAPAYDAGSEANTESCDDIPGPPCGNPFQRVTDGAEGFVHVHRGIHGAGELSSIGYDWRNPVVAITITRD